MKRMRWPAYLGLLLALSCGTWGVRRPEHPAPPAAPASTRPGDCPTHKLAFTQATGCQNDGSVEFCLPKDPQFAVRIRALAPELQGPRGSGGRARCDLTREDLYFLPTRPGLECAQGSHSLTQEAWVRLCRVAEDPAVSRIVPTWFE